MPVGAGPCAGIRVLDLSSMVSGPYCGQVLGDLGADVIKLEGLEGDTLRRMQPVRGDISAIFTHFNRNKRSIAVDLKSQAGPALALRLAASVDVLIENFRPGVAERLGLGYEVVSARNRGIVYLSINGFGESGPYADQPAYDHVIQGLVGFMSVQGGARQPTAVKSAIADKIAALSATIAALAALNARAGNGGIGQKVNVRMLDAFSTFMWSDRLRDHTFLDDPPPTTPIPDTFQALQTADGFVIGIILQDSQFAGICAALQRPDLLHHPDFADPGRRVTNVDALYDAIRDDVRRLSTAAFLALARRHGVPFAPVNDIEGFLDDPQVRHNRAHVERQDDELGRLRQLGFLADFQRTPLEIRRHAPKKGEHTDEVLRELGYGDADIAALRTGSVVG